MNPEPRTILLFSKEKLTLAQASRLAGMDRLRFQHLLASRQIPVHYDVEDFEENLRTLRQLGATVIVVSDTSPIVNLAAVGLLLLDERKGRKAASRFGLNFVGLLGVLVEAKRKGFIPEVKPVLEKQDSG